MLDFLNVPKDQRKYVNAKINLNNLRDIELNMDLKKVMFINKIDDD